MPEPTVLYSVTAVVLLGLVIWVAAVLMTVKLPWARTVAPLLATDTMLPDDTPRALAEPAAAPSTDADTTAKATPVALASEKAKAASPAPDEAKDGAGDA